MEVVPVTAGPTSNNPVGTGTFSRLGLTGIHQPNQISQVPFDQGWEDEVVPIDRAYQRPVGTAAFVECLLQIPLFDAAILKRGTRRGFIH